MVYGIGLPLIGLFFLWLEWEFLAGIAGGFFFGFIFAVDRVYKVATGTTLTSPKADEVYRKIL